MSDLIKSSVETSNEQIVKYQVQDNVNNDKIIRHQVMKIGSDPVIESLNVTENGTYNAPSGTDGYNPIVVNVSQTLPTMQLLSDIRIDTDNNKIYDFARNCDVTNDNVVLNDDIMEVAVNGYIQTMIGLSNQTSYKIEIDIDSIPQPTPDSRGITLINFSPRGGDNVYLGYDNRVDYTTKTFYMYGSSGYNYPESSIGNINYDYFDNGTIDIYFNAVYNTSLSRWTKNQIGENSDKFRLYAHNSNLELVSNGRSGASDEIQNLKIGRPNNTMIANIKAIRVYLLNGLEVV